MRRKMAKRANAFAYNVYIVYSSSFNIYKLNYPPKYDAANPDYNYWL